MTEENQNPEPQTVEGETLDDLAQEWEAEQADQEAEANQPDPEETRRAEALAKQINGSFLWIVNRTQCPHVNIEEIVKREQGDEAFLPLAEKWGGEVPPWMEALQPYLAAGVYMGTTIVTARQVERQILEQAERQKAEQEETEHGQESEPVTP